MNSKSTFFLTYLTEFSLLVAGLLVYRFAFDALLDTEFACYSLVRRNLSFFIPILFLGLAVGIPRFVSFHIGNKIKVGNYFISGAFLLFISLAIFSILMFVFKSQFAYFLFGEKAYHYLALPFLVLIWGIALHAFTYAYFRGMMKMGIANLLQFTNLCIGTLLAFYFYDTLMGILYFTGVFWFLTSSIFFIGILVRVNFQWNMIRATSKELFKYSIFRVPGDLALAGLLSFPSLVVAHFYGIIPAGYLAFGITLLNMSGAAFSPISLLLLPKTSKLAAEKKYNLIFKNTNKILVITLLLSISAIIIFEIFATHIIHIYLNAASPELIQTARIIALGIPGYTIYIVLRSVLDAIHYKAVNTRNLLFVFLFYASGMIVLLFFNFDKQFCINANIWLFTCALTILGFITYLDIRKSKNYFLNPKTNK